jgi:hypothetical protein
LSDSVSRRYGIDRDRCLAMPMAKSPFLQVGIPVATSLVLKKYNFYLNSASATTNAQAEFKAKKYHWL